MSSLHRGSCQRRCTATSDSVYIPASMPGFGRPSTAPMTRRTPGSIYHITSGRHNHHLEGRLYNYQWGGVTFVSRLHSFTIPYVYFAGNPVTFRLREASIIGRCGAA